MKLISGAFSGPHKPLSVHMRVAYRNTFSGSFCIDKKTPDCYT